VGARRLLWIGALVACVILTQAAAQGAGASPSSPAANRTATGKKLYREFCGQCHALSKALSAGFGSSNAGGLGTNGGPSFNDLRIPFQLSIVAVTEPTGGHEKVKKRIRWSQLSQVATYIAQATSRNPIPAEPTDG
jgi:mono/diheme cytochrome c family protein